MLLDLKFSIGTLGLGAGTFVAALYGMNLKNFIEESDFGFAGISLWCAVLTGLVVAVAGRKLRTVQRLSMWGENQAVALERAASSAASGLGPGTARAGMEGVVDPIVARAERRRKEALLSRWWMGRKSSSAASKMAAKLARKK
jgi:hypothetical protein